MKIFFFWITAKFKIWKNLKISVSETSISSCLWVKLSLFWLMTKIAGGIHERTWGIWAQKFRKIFQRDVVDERPKRELSVITLKCFFLESDGKRSKSIFFLLIEQCDAFVEFHGNRTHTYPFFWSSALLLSRLPIEFTFGIAQIGSFEIPSFLFLDIS